MKLKNITVALATLLTLSACVDESLITPPSPQGNEGLPAVLKLTLTTDAVVTKASMPTLQEEFNINNVALAAYTNDATPTLIGFTYKGSFTTADRVACAEDNQDGYVVSVPAEIGSVKILALANATASEATLKTAAASYTTFKALAENAGSAYAFESDKLVKFADTTVVVSVAVPSAHIKVNQLAARVDVYVGIKQLSDPDANWTFDMSGYRVEGINSQSDAFLGDYFADGTYTYNTKDAKINNPATDYINDTFLDATAAKKVISNNDGNSSYAFSFYTYERQTSEAAPLTIKIKGSLTDVNAPTGTPAEAKTYAINFNPTKKSATQKTDGLIHGNLYQVNGSINVTTKNIEFTYTILPWQDIRLVDVTIKPIYYLQVKDLVMSMPNMTSIATTYQSSSPVSIINLKTYAMKEAGDVADATPKVTVTTTGVNDGTINIAGELPTNYVPRKITFTVQNENGLTQDVTVTQYPPLYIEAKLSDYRKDASNSQTNWNMYKFTSLVADYSAFPYPDELNEATTIRNNAHPHNQGTSQTRGDGFTNYIKDNAIMGFPLLDANGYTVNSVENNRRISPNFMLASQYGTSSTGSSYAQAQKDGVTGLGIPFGTTDANGIKLFYSYKQPSCADYVEKQNGVTYSDWRLPTKAEIYVIDILQNVKACAVKAILEGTRYWSAESAGSIYFMDARLEGASATETTQGAFRCVHDIK